MQLAQWLDPLVLGDLKAGVETLEEARSSGEFGIALVWFSAIPASQQAEVYRTDLEGVVLDDEDVGNWAFRVRISGVARAPDPAQHAVLVRDGHELQGVAQSLGPEYGSDPVDAARRVAVALMARRTYPALQGTWSWKTPLGRNVRVDVWRTSGPTTGR